MENILDMANQNMQDSLKKFQEIKNKEHEKQINKLRTSTNTKVKQRTL
jgi:hypothetical protein